MAVEGQECKGVYWDLMEILCERGGKLRFSDCVSIAYDLRVPVDKLERIIRDYGLFSYDDKEFWCEELLFDIKSNKRRVKALINKTKKEYSGVCAGVGRISKPYKIMMQIVDIWNNYATDNPISKEQVDANKGRWMKYIKELLKIYRDEKVIIEKFSEIISDYDNLWEGARDLSYILIPGNFTDILSGRHRRKRDKGEKSKDNGEERLDYQFLT